VGSGREPARLSVEHDAYRWICGGVSVNYHALNDFRAGNAELMDELLTDNVAALAAAGAITLARVAQDGMRVRADAGALSFRRQASLQEHLSQARALVQTIKRQVQTDPGQAQRRAQAARLRAARILLFDEATSHLDRETSELLAQTINRLRSGHTILFIAHHVPAGLRVDRELVTGAEATKIR